MSTRRDPDAQVLRREFLRTSLNDVAQGAMAGAAIAAALIRTLNIVGSREQLKEAQDLFERLQQTEEWKALDSERREEITREYEKLIADLKRKLGEE